MKFRLIGLAFFLLWARAIVVGLPRISALLFPNALPHEEVHAACALVGLLVLPGVVWTCRSHRLSVSAWSGIFLAFTTILAPLLTPYSTSASLLPPNLAPGLGHLFGTDETGADVLSRVLYGARVSLGVGLIAAGVAAAVGTILGAAGGFFGGMADRVTRFVTDIFLSVPRLALVLVVVGLYHPDAWRFWMVSVTLGLTGWMGVARVVRAQVLSVRERDFVVSARALGLSEWAVLRRHVLPHVAAPVVVFATLALGDTVLAEAGLAYLGRGASSGVSWGTLLAGTGVTRMATTPWVGIFPGLVLLFTVSVCNRLGDELRDRLDPRLRADR